jgi:plasmid stabilization system protein ParE
MKNRVIITSLAKKDLEDAVKWYEERKKGLGKQLVIRVQERMKVIQRNPKSFQIKYKMVHTAVIQQFPYMIHYQFDEKNEIIKVIAILHTYRNPNIWQTRI